MLPSWGFSVEVLVDPVMDSRLTLSVGLWRMPLLRKAFVDNSWSDIKLSGWMLSTSVWDHMEDALVEGVDVKMGLDIGEAGVGLAWSGVIF